MSLKNEAGQNVEIFAIKVHNIAIRVHRYSNSPDNLPSLVAKCFLVCDVKVFYLTSICLHDNTNQNWNTSNWEVILLELKAKYRTCVSQNL